MTQSTEKVKVITQAEGKGFKVEVLEYASLEGGQNLSIAPMLYFANQVGLHLKFVRLQLIQGEAILEAGALYFMKGHIAVTSKAGGSGGIGGLARGIATKMLTNETVFRPRYKGTGEIYLEPSFGHFLVYSLQPKESLIADKGMFYCAEGSVNVSVAVQQNISSGLLGGEGWFQTKVIGPGVCVFSSPVPSSEVIAYDLQNEKLQVDGNFALMRTDGIKFSVQKSTKGLLGTASSGEGLLQTFEGTGRVWVAPTQAVYERLTNPYVFAQMVNSQGTSHTQTR
ncbi:MAG: AIM24 family protein [Anaerolineae bacterium]|nr:AIM24 family protein [Anaerolineae bacterium]